MKHKILLIILITFLAISKNKLQAQSSLPVYGFEVYGGIGATHFSGDITGNKGLINFDSETINYAFTGGLMYHFTNRWAVRANFLYGRVYADDAYSDDEFKRGRNLNFRSTVADLSLQARFSILNWNVKNVRHKKYDSRKEKNKHNLYVFGGVSLFGFTPQGELNGQWYDLPELSTEGQGLDNGPEPYSLFAVSVPVGVGYRYLVSKTVSVGVELSYNKTFTDYLDDVSTDYYDNSILRQERGNLAANIADKNTFNEGVKRRAGDGRGNPDVDDSFAYFTITISKRLTLHRNSRFGGIPCPTVEQ